MPNTAKRGYAYPSQTDVPDVPYFMQTALDKVDTDVAKLYDDTGEVAFTLASGWTSLTPCTYRIRGGVVTFTLACTATSTRPANSTICTLPTAARPQARRYFPTVSNNATSAVEVYTDGTIHQVAEYVAGLNITVSGSFTLNT